MAKTRPLRIREPLSEDEDGVVYRAKDANGQRVHLRKPKAADVAEPLLPSEKKEIYQKAISTLRKTHHASLLQVVSGGTDPEDGLPYVTTKPCDAARLADHLKRGPLSIESTTLLLIQALELSDVISHLLECQGVWIETHAENILMTEQASSPRFLFWPDPLTAVTGSNRPIDFSGIIDLAERVLDWKESEIDEREGGHLQLWLKWLRKDGGDADIHEVREMLAAAAGIEPPPTVEQLLENAQSKRTLFDGWPQLQSKLRQTVPKMPLLAILSVMLIFQAIIGWMIVRKINESTDNKLQQINTGSSFGVSGGSGRERERGSQPLDFD